MRIAPLVFGLGMKVSATESVFVSLVNEMGLSTCAARDAKVSYCDERFTHISGSRPLQAG